jgi:hypothetical protein
MPDMDLKSYPSNSRKIRVEKVEPEQAPRKPLEKVVTGVVVKKKKNFLDNVAETFFGDDAKNVGQYIVWDVLIPAAKETVRDMVSTGIEMLLFGENGRGRLSRGRDRGSSKPYISYNTISDRSRERTIRPERLEARSRSRHNFDEIIFESWAEADGVLDGLLDALGEYQTVSVADFYDLAGIASEFSDNKYGWENLSQAGVQRTRDGYIVVLPKPYPLEQR